MRRELKPYASGLRNDSTLAMLRKALAQAAFEGDGTAACKSCNDKAQKEGRTARAVRPR
jgi:hypothetical protein